jgi:hypothetical protein
MMAAALVLLLVAVVGVLVVGTHNTAAATLRQSAAAADGYASSEAGKQYARGVVNIVLGDTVSANSDDVSVDGTTVTIEAAGVYSVSGTLADGRIVVDAKGKVYLEFNGVDITSDSGPALYIADAKKVTLTLVEGTTNSLADSGAKSEHHGAIYSNDTLIINGKGSLAVTGNSREGISCDDDIIINAGTLVVRAVEDGLSAHDDITITGGDVYVVAGGDGLDSNGTINISGGKLVALASDVAGDGGLDAIGDVTITGGTVIASGKSIAVPSDKSTQASLYVATGANQVAGTSVSVVLDGEEILTFAPGREYQNLLISSDHLVAGKTYEVYIGSSDVPIRAVADATPAGAGGSDHVASMQAPAGDLERQGELA